MALTELRKGAGYRTAKEFAEALGVPATTYSRYEANPDKIPLAAAWSIADFLGCTIDEVVGHEAAGIAGGEWQVFYDSLSPEGRELMDDLRQLVSMRERRTARRAEVSREARYDVMLRHYERIFYAQSDEEDGFGDAAFAPRAEARRAFQAFLEERARPARDGGARGDGEEAGAGRDGATDEQDRYDEEVIAGIMEAYDRAHGTSAGV